MSLQIIMMTMMMMKMLANTYVLWVNQQQCQLEIKNMCNEIALNEALQTNHESFYQKPYISTKDVGKTSEEV